MSKVQETRIYVGNISPDTTKVTLKETFEKVGAVSKLRVLQRRRKTIVYAFITFEAAADAKKAVGDLNETELDGNKIIVEEARPIDEEVLAQRKENKKKNRKLKRQAQQQVKKEEQAAKKEGDDTKKEEAKTTEVTETETKPKKKNNNNRKRKVKKEEGSGSEEAQSEPTKKDAPTEAKMSPEPAIKEVNKEKDTKAEAAKKEEKKSTNPAVKKDEKKEEATTEKKKEADNKAKSTTTSNNNKEKSEEKAVKPEKKKREAKDGESKNNRISPETGVFVANLPFSAKTADLQELFKNYNIKTAKIARGGYRSKGYGFVEAATAEEQQKILKEFKEVEFKERIITVKPLISKGDEE